MKFVVIKRHFFLWHNQIMIHLNIGYVDHVKKCKKQKKNRAFLSSQIRGQASLFMHIGTILGLRQCKLSSHQEANATVNNS